MSKFTKVSFNQEKRIHFGEHETLLSFNDDEANWAFQEWWDIKGSELFNDWLKDSIGWKHLVSKNDGRDNDTWFHNSDMECR
jgi:hypothetical protein